MASPDASSWDPAQLAPLTDQLWRIRRSMLESVHRHGTLLDAVEATHYASAVNLLHYLALRRHDLRALQDELARLGLSSLGRAETHALANIDKVLGLLHRLAGKAWADRSAEEPNGLGRGLARLAEHADQCFGPAPAGRATRIMVTLPSEAADDDALVGRLVDAGMDIARINCAHDAAPQWQAMAERVRHHARRAGRPVKVLMDLGGPKLRTGPIESGPAVLKLQPRRDAYGHVVAPAVLALHPSGSSAASAATPAHATADHVAGVDPAWLQRLRPGDRVGLTDARGSSRRMTVSARQDAVVLLHAAQTCYLTEQVSLRLHRPDEGIFTAALTDLPPQPGHLHLQRGDTVRLVAEGLGRPAVLTRAGKVLRPASIAITLPEALTMVRPGERVWFDDGRLGGVVQRRRVGTVDVALTDVRAGGDRLAPDKGINLPDSRLDLPALTAQDMADLPVVARCADLVGLSFAQSAQDVLQLRRALADRGAQAIGIVLKIETRRGFEALPDMLLAALQGPTVGVMIARGDLAVECGFERMAEIQEEILWLCEAAHVPVVWATQVLETLARTGRPSRAEITDAAMGGRAECVMLNKGPHIVEAIQTLSDILSRMQDHQTKKRPLLRALRSWRLGG